MSEHVLSDLGLNHSHASTTTQSSNVTEAYLLMGRMQLRERISHALSKDIDIKDFCWKVSLWDTSAHRLSRDLLESFDSKLEAKEKEKLFVLELLESSPVHLVVSVCHCLTGMPFATGSCLLVFDQEMHDLEFTLMTDPSSGLTQQDMSFSFLTSYAIISDTLDVSKWAGTDYDFQQTAQPKVSALTHDYELFPDGKEMEISLAEDVHEISLDDLDNPIKAAKASRNIKAVYTQPSEVYYTTVEDIQLAHDIHEKFEKSKLCVTVRLTPRLKRGNALIEGMISNACFLGYLIDSEGLWSKDVQLGTPLREDTLSFTLDIYIIAVPMNAQIEHEQHLKNSGSVEMVCHGKYKVPVHSFYPSSRSIEVDLHRAPSEIWTEVIKKTHISDNPAERLPVCGKIIMNIRNFFTRKYNMWLDLLDENCKSIDVYKKYKNISFQSCQANNIGDENNGNITPDTVHARMVQTPSVVSSWRGNEWNCLSVLAKRLKIGSRISKRLDVEPPALAKSALLSPSSRSQSSNSPFSPASPGTKKTRKSSLLRGDEKELAILAMTTSILASLADSVLPFAELSQRLCPKEEAAFSGTGRALQFTGPDYVMPLLWMVVMNWKAKPDVSTMLRYDVHNTFKFSKTYSSSRTEVFITLRGKNVPIPTVQYQMHYHEHELKAIEIILKMVYVALNVNKRLTSLQILGVTGVTPESVKELVNVICTKVFICPLLIDLVCSLENHDSIDESFVRDYFMKGQIVIRLLSSLTVLDQELFTEETITTMLAFVADSLRLIASHVTKVCKDYDLYAHYACSVLLLLKSVASHSEFYVDVLKSVLKSSEPLLDGTDDSVFKPVLTMLMQVAETNFLLYITANEKKKRPSRNVDCEVDIVAESRLLPVSFRILSIFFRTHLPLTDTCRFVCVLATKCLVLDFNAVHNLDNLLSELRYLYLISNVSGRENDVSLNSIPKILKPEVSILLTKLLERFHERRTYSDTEKYEIGSVLLLLSKYLASYATNILLSSAYKSFVTLVLSRIIAPHDPRHSYILIGLMHLGINTTVSKAREHLFRISYTSYLDIVCIRENSLQPHVIEITSKHMKIFEEYAKILVKYVGIAALESDKSVQTIERYLSSLFDFDPRVVRSLHRSKDAQIQLMELVDREEEFLTTIFTERGFKNKAMAATAVKCALKKILGAYNFFILCAKNNKLFDLSCESLNPAVSTRPIDEFSVSEITKASEVLKCLDDKHLIKLLEFEDDLQHMILIRGSIEDYYDSRLKSSLSNTRAKKSMITYSHTLLYMSSLANLLSVAPIDSAQSLLGRCTLLDSLKSILIYDGSSAAHFGIANSSAVAVHRYIVRLHYTYMSLITKVSDVLVDQTTGNFIAAPNSPRRNRGEKIIGTKDKAAVKIKMSPISSSANELLYNDALDCISLLNSCGEWKCSMKIIDATMSILNRIPGFKDQSEEAFGDRFISLKKELSISRDICTEKLDADVKLVPKPLFYAVRFTSPPKGGMGDFWVVYRFDSSCFAHHFDELSPVGIPPAFYTEFVNYLKTEFPHYIPYPSNTYLPADKYMRVMQVFHAHPVMESSGKIPTNSPTIFHVYYINEDSQILAHSEALKRVNIKSTFAMTAVNKITLSMSVSEEEQGRLSLPGEEHDERMTEIHLYREDIAQLKALTTWVSPMNLLNIVSKESIEQSECLLEILRQQSSLLHSIHVMLEEILSHTPSVAIIEGVDSRLICVKSVFINAVTHLANIIIGDVNREFHEGSQCFGLHNADVIIAGEEERRVLQWQSVRKNEKRKLIKEQKEEVSNQERLEQKTKKEQEEIWYDYGNDVGSPTKTNITTASDMNKEKTTSGSTHLDLSSLEVAFSKETETLLSHLVDERDDCETLCNHIIDRLWQITDVFFPLLEKSHDAGNDMYVEPVGDARIVRELVGWIDGAFSTVISGSNL